MWGHKRVITFHPCKAHHHAAAHCCAHAHAPVPNPLVSARSTAARADKLEQTKLALKAQKEAAKSERDKHKADKEEVGRPCNDWHADVPHVTAQWLQLARARKSQAGFARTMQPGCDAACM